MEGDYDFYSEDVPPPVDEEEILEFEPSEEKEAVADTSKTTGVGIEQLNTNKKDDRDMNNVQVDNTEVITIKSREDFEKELVRSLDQVDFSRNRGYNVEKVRSTRSQVISRIKSELLELELGNQLDENSEKDDQEIQVLKNRLKNISLGESSFVKEWIMQIHEFNSAIIRNKRELGTPDTGKGKYTESVVSTKDSSKELEYMEERFLNMEGRLKEMENLVGGSMEISNSSDSDHLTIQDEIDDLYRRINLIFNSKKLTDDAQDRFKKASDSLQKYKQKKGSIDGPKLDDFVPASDRRIHLIFKRLQRVETYETAIPLLIGRLRAMNSIVSETSGTINFMKNLDSELSKTEMEVIKWNTKLDDLERKSEAKQQTWNKDKNLIKKWIHSLEEKLKVLQ
ncbi:hypothetical protein HII12_004642 [Brettanomyces bruxellensis]|uniref:DEBR0S6_06700g1_1 n=1 Tax=Dekkera bruxellensis TaxID=5007 RepID=A0A7D9H2C8_DEKBR|nr:hypothetical protein HII12_004642 [Brettanomyces bruxellensis]VUG20046.1 DEBR0S6_06700g1_1 [Brettanomyces bruxellensis]